MNAKAKTLILLALAVPAFSLTAGDAFAKWGRHHKCDYENDYHDRHDRGKRFRIHHRGRNYFYEDGMFFRKAGFGFVAIAPPMGVIVPVLPFGYAAFHYGPGLDFYCMGGIYYRHVPEGYMVVPEDEFERNRRRERHGDRHGSRGNSREREYSEYIPDTDGTITSVKFEKSDSGYLGFQGEFRDGKPSMFGLSMLFSQ